MSGLLGTYAPSCSPPRTLKRLITEEHFLSKKHLKFVSRCALGRLRADVPQTY